MRNQWITCSWVGTGPLWGKKEVCGTSPLCNFWTIWKAKNKITLEDDVLSIQRLKSSFVCFLWSKTKLFRKKWSFDFSWFHWLSEILIRVAFLLLHFWQLFFVPIRERGASFLYILSHCFNISFQYSFFSFTCPNKKGSTNPIKIFKITKLVDATYSFESYTYKFDSILI